MLFLIYLIFAFIFYIVRLYMYIVLSNIDSIVFGNNCIWKFPSLKVLNATLQFHSDARISVLMTITKEIITYNMMQRLNFSIIKDQTLRQIISENYEKRNANNQYFLSLLLLSRLLKTFNGIFLLSVLIMSRTLQSESTLYSCLNVKELLAQNRREIWTLSNCNGTRIYNHLVRTRTPNHLIKLAFVRPLYDSSIEKETFKNIYDRRRIALSKVFKFFISRVLLYLNLSMWLYQIWKLQSLIFQNLYNTI